MPVTRPRLVCFVDMLGSDYVARVLAGMQGPVADAGWELKILEGGQLLWEARLALLRREAADPANVAFAFAHFHLTLEQAAIFHGAGKPMGNLGGSVQGVHCVLDDGFEGTMMAVSHLASLGHQRIAFLIGDRLVAEARDREAGIRSAVLDHTKMDLATTVLMTRRVKPALAKEGCDAALELLRSVPRPTALFCAAGDLVASGAYLAAAKLGLRIPQDLSVMGYDDLPMAAAMQPALSTLHQPLEAMGAKLAVQLIAAAKGDATPPQIHTVKPSLVPRASCAAPKA